jgi:catechol 2,3-dioxygenase-like lactoylglutathione lyase family enzyme
MNEHPTDGESGWPGRLRPGALRFARASSNYAATVTFYRDLVRLPMLGSFADSFGADGTIFGLPDASQGKGRDTDQLVLYLDNAAAVPAATSRLRTAGLSPDPHPHAYWAANGAVTFRDPDGRAVIFAPWVFARDPDPVDDHPPSPDKGVA